MGYIKLTIERNHETLPFFFFHADYLHEAWLAKVYDDGKTKIIKQFKCRKLEDCFYELASFVVHLGEVKKMEASEIEEDKISLLRDAIDNAYPEPPFPGMASLGLSRSLYKNVAVRVLNSFPPLGMAS
ncbi:MAG TPA: helix-loop-helix domain-containing protein [Flavobacterium sp.]|jgi:hypothetical protein